MCVCVHLREHICRCLGVYRGQKRAQDCLQLEFQASESYLTGVLLINRPHVPLLVLASRHVQQCLSPFHSSFSYVFSYFLLLSAIMNSDAILLLSVTENSDTGHFGAG